ncbi:hypothetical protein LTR60_003740 [Cryomyces antarcticus]|nr:hypothetical protein LTR60_003740 [Cryomyces antarcticus]KAK5015471.1 hypothetical protein LTR39_002597 [Cryomyces antarcticus]KAK5139794.1 hypothetical protein LTR04_003333 [Oleoguttula sp. CCFEE 6159]
MAYLFYSISFFSLILATILYITRTHWTPYAPPIPYLTAPGPIPSFIYPYLPSRVRYTPLSTGGSFHDDMEAGFSSAAFDLSGNVEAGDSRRGLDERGKREVQRIMKGRGVGFDEARRLWMEERFGRENIGKDGRPRDPKAVMFS